jgi:hypothetical protein
MKGHRFFYSRGLTRVAPMGLLRRVERQAKLVSLG